MKFRLISNSFASCVSDSVLFGMYADDSYSYVQKDEMDKLVLDSEGQISSALSDLFLEVNPDSRFLYFGEWRLVLCI